MKRLSSLFILLAVALFAMAQERSSAELKAIAFNTLNGLQRNSSTLGTKSTKVISHGQIAQLDSTQQLSVMGYKDGGFVVLARDSRVDAVLGYSDTAYDADDNNPGFNWWKQAMEQSIDYYLATGTKMPKAAPSGKHVGVAQLVTTKWNQDSPFNDKAPKYGTTHYPIGCVATAMGQIMKYHNWPDTGVGRSTYRASKYDENGTETGTVQLSVGFSSGNYDWPNMLDVYSRGYNSTQAEAVSKLLYHCAVAVKMGFTPSGSGSFTFTAIDALRNYFKYNPFLHFYQRQFMSVDEWMELVYTSLDNKRPILYGGQSASQGGHEFVIDGYDTDGKVHVNWGWGGSRDGYFDIASLNGFSSYQDMCPVTLTEDGGSYASLFGFRGNFTARLYSGNTYTLTVPYANNIDLNSFTGTFAAIAANRVTGEKTVLAQTSSVSVEGHGAGGYYQGTTPQISRVDLSGLADGTYRLYLASKGTTTVEINKVSYTWSDTDWQPVRSNEQYNNSVLVTVSNGKASVENENNPDWVLNPTGISSITVNKSTADGTVRVYNAAGILLYSAPAASFNIDNVKAQGVLIIRQGDTVRKVMKH